MKPDPRFYMKKTSLFNGLAETGEKRLAAVINRTKEIDGSFIFPADMAEEAASVMALSDFVYTGLLRKPEILIDLVKKKELLFSKSRADFMRAFMKSTPDDFMKLQAAFRNTRNREMIRIAWRDLAGRCDILEVFSDLTNLAEASLTCGSRILQKGLEEEYGSPSQEMIIIGMGKLGARELNFSSDIDLILAYPEEGFTTGAASITNERFFSILGKRLISLIGARTAEGIVFRVDLRLRPFGENGPLVMSFDGMENYYQAQGREWERYAWIKARVVAGPKKAGEILMQKMAPFVFRRYLDFGAFESLRRMKEMIAAEVRRKGMEKDIKLGPGGIREVEFFGQIFQLIRGGVIPGLRTPSIIEALAKIAKIGQIPEDLAQGLTRAYLFLRYTENRLQAFSDKQIHRLPEDPATRARLAVSLGFKRWESFEKALASHRRFVHEAFENLMSPVDTGSGSLSADPVWHNRESREKRIARLEALGFKDAGEVDRILYELRDLVDSRYKTPEGRRRIDRLMPHLIEKAAGCKDPVPVLKRLSGFFTSIHSRTSYLALLDEHPRAMDHLVRLSEASPWIVTHLTRHPVLLDELLDHRNLYLPLRKEDLTRSLDELVDSESDDLELQMEQLCVFKHSRILRVAAADITGAIPLMKVSDYLSEIAEVIIAKAAEISLKQIAKRSGIPAQPEEGAPGFAIIAYGKLGGLELGYDSDLDLVFIHAGEKDPAARAGGTPLTSQFYIRLGQRIIHMLNTFTPAGRVYEIDMRLRPSGASGILVSHIDSFESYQMEDAWTWEHQALVKARPVFGDPELVGRFEKIRRRILAKKRDKGKLAEEVAGMRKKIKEKRSQKDKAGFDIKDGAGGLLDIEFLVQFLVLAHSCKHGKLTAFTDNVRIIQELYNCGIVDEKTAYILRKAYLVLRAAGHRLSLQQRPHIVENPSFMKLRQLIRNAWKAYLG